MNIRFTINKLVKRYSHQHTKKTHIINCHKPISYPTCNDCVHFIQSKTNDIYNSKCNKFMKYNFITRERDLSTIDVIRSHYELCGPQAKHKKLITND